MLMTGSGAEEKVIDYGNNPAAGHYYDINGFKMYCEIYGTGQPLLMIHGNGGSIKSLAGIIPYFANHYRVIVPDSRAQGKSIDQGKSLTFEMMADDFAALLDTLHIPSADVFGWSDGGINGLLLSIRHPEKVAKLAVTGANISPDASAFSPASHVWQWENEHYASCKNRVWTTDAERTSWKLFLLDFTRPNIPLTALHTIRCPSLIICGDHDLISVEHTVLIYKNIPHAWLWVVPNSGHATLDEHRDEFDQMVGEFFSNP
jgi:pimeloyl-ACP methyl ester carboxylesterase